MVGQKASDGGLGRTPQTRPCRAKIRDLLRLGSCGRDSPNVRGSGGRPAPRVERTVGRTVGPWRPGGGCVIIGLHGDVEEQLAKCRHGAPLHFLRLVACRQRQHVHNACAAADDAPTHDQCSQPKSVSRFRFYICSAAIAPKIHSTTTSHITCDCDCNSTVLSGSKQDIDSKFTTDCARPRSC